MDKTALFEQTDDLYLAGEHNEAQGKALEAIQLYERAAEALRASGPVGEASSTRLSLPVVLMALGLALKLRGDTGAAERTYILALDECDSWPDWRSPEDCSLACSVLQNLVILYQAMHAHTKMNARCARRMFYSVSPTRCAQDTPVASHSGRRRRAAAFCDARLCWCEPHNRTTR